MSEIKLCNGYHCKCKSDQCTCSIACVHALYMNGPKWNQRCPCGDCYNFQSYFSKQTNLTVKDLLTFVSFQPIPSSEALTNSSSSDYDLLKVWIMEINQGLQRITQFPYRYCPNSTNSKIIQMLQEIYSTIYETTFESGILTILKSKIV